MKKLIGIMGVIALSTVITYSSNNIQDGKIINLDTLMTLNKANAEGGSGSDSCCSEFTNGTATLVRFCLDCRQKRAESAVNDSTC